MKMILALNRILVIGCLLITPAIGTVGLSTIDNTKDEAALNLGLNLSVTDTGEGKADQIFDVTCQKTGAYSKIQITLLMPTPDGDATASWSMVAGKPVSASFKIPKKMRIRCKLFISVTVKPASSEEAYDIGYFVDMEEFLKSIDQNKSKSDKGN